MFGLLRWRLPRGHRIRPGDPVEARREMVRRTLDPLLKELDGMPEFRVFRGPSVAEVQLLRNVSKSFGLRRICRILGFDPSKDRVLYAGGAARVPGAKVVEHPVALARAIGALAGVPPQRGKGKS